MDQEKLEVVRQTFHIVDLIARSIRRRCGKLIELVEDDYVGISAFVREKLIKELTKIQDSTEELEKEKKGRLEPILEEKQDEDND